MGVAVDVTGCGQPVTVTVVVAGTAEYWLDHRSRLGPTSTLKLVLPGAVRGGVTLGTGRSAGDVLLPPSASEPLNEDPAVRLTSTTVLDGRQADYSALSVSASVRGWGATFAPVVARYRADSWLTERGIGSCHLRLPAVTGERSIVASQQADGRAKPAGELLPTDPTDVIVSSSAKRVEAIYRVGVGAQAGYVTVRMGGGSVGAEESVPSPDQRFDGHSTWTCRSRARRASVGNQDRGGVPGLLIGPSIDTTGALSQTALDDGTLPDCSASAVVVESSAASKRDAYLLVAGALFGLGAALLCELLLALASRRHPRMHAADLQSTDSNTGPDPPAPGAYVPVERPPALGGAPGGFRHALEAGRAEALARTAAERPGDA